MKSIKAIAGDILEPPPEVRRLRGRDNHFIDKSGNVYSYTAIHPNGRIATVFYDMGSPYIVIKNENGKNTNVHIAKAMLVAFKGRDPKDLTRPKFKDGNKQNLKLDNIY
jgi:rRNA processing protein Gar1